MNHIPPSTNTSRERRGPEHPIRFWVIFSLSIAAAGLLLDLTRSCHVLPPALTKLALEHTLPLLLLILVTYWSLLRPLLREIARRKQTEQALQESKERFRSIYERAGTGILLADLQGRLLDANPYMQRMLGFSEDEINARTLKDITHPDDQASSDEVIHLLTSGQENQHTWEKRYVRKDGMIVWGRVTSVLVHDAAGRPDYLIGMVEDITKRKQAEEALLASERQFRGVLENVQLLAVMLDVQGNIVFCNDYLLRLTGWRTEEVLGRNWFEAFLPDDQREQVEQLFLESQERGDIPVRFEHTIITRQGERRLIAWNNSLMYNVHAELIGTTSIGEDITERTLTEERLRLAARIIDNTIEGVMVTDDQAVIHSVNPAFTSITGYSAEDAIGKKPNILRSDRHDTAFYQEMWRSLLEDGQWEGEIWNRRKNGEAYPEWLSISAVKDTTGKTVQYVSIFNDITEHKRNQERIEYLAYHDALTGLPNRFLFNDRLTLELAHAKRHDSKLAVLFLDLDRFKTINDSLGHIIGDQLLQAVASRLTDSVRNDDTVARLGGDEFTLVMPSLASEAEAAKVAEKIINAFSRPFQVGKHQLYITASIGISLYPSDGPDTAVLVRNADIAMYRAKERGRNTYQLYAPMMKERIVERLTMEQALRTALERNEFLLHYEPRVDLATVEPAGSQSGFPVLHYQPKYDISTGEVRSMEALIRWQHPEWGLVPPAEFIALAEETGMIVQIGEWVLRAACMQNRVWQAEGAPPLRVAVNLSARQFRQTDLVEMVARVLQETGLDPQYLELEITESAAMDDVEKSLVILNALHALGVQLSMDDFGTGYSSLGYLSRFPVQSLKIDKSFVQSIPANHDDTAIASSVIALAHSLQLKVIAEGVETEEQLAFLREHQCDETQGFFFSHPLPAEEFARAYLLQPIA